MPTPSKPVNVIRMEGKSHRTKRELVERERAEAQLLTGKIIREQNEVKENELAHKEFQRIRKLLKSVGKDDDLYGATINRYCLLQAECIEFQEKREQFYRQIEELEDDRDAFADADDLGTYYKLQMSMQKNILALDKQVQAKRKMLLDIEKENIMTIASSLRSVPKKTEKKRNPIMEALAGGD
ncbi:MAG: hypothetical protein ENTB_03855 [Enterocloster aldenensis]